MTIELFVKAASSGDIETMKGMLEQEPELIKKKLQNGMGPLTAALYYGREAAVVWLLEQPGLDVTIHEAAMLGDDTTLARMLDPDPELLTLFSYDGWTPLHLAAFFGGLDAAELLIKRGADVNAKSVNAMENMPIHAAAARRGVRMVKLLLEHGADVNARQSGGWTPLHQAADNGDVLMVKLLLQRGADVSAEREDGKTARMIAESKGFTEIVDLMA